MASNSSQNAWLDIDRFVEAFDLAWAGEGVPNLVEYLPPAESSQFADVLVELVRVDLEMRWQRGCGKSLAEYRATFSSLFDDPAAMSQLAFEEYRARRQAGEAVEVEEYARRYAISTASWPDRMHAESTLGVSSGKESPAADAATTPFWHVDAERLGFRLIEELGQGAFSRVYLARQTDLSNRLVVLKVSNESFTEADKLAQLQHAHIVPIYSIHHIGNAFVVCMPYFGRTTLADLLGHVEVSGTLPASGKRLVDTLRECRTKTRRLDDGGLAPGMTCSQDDAGDDRGSHGKPAAVGIQALSSMNYVDAVLWIGVRLASGLSHAHERGILHRDLKPANVLLADDGRPMLLDFNLSEDLKTVADVGGAIVGGTLPYMAPEQLQAFQQRSSSSDPRSDIYSLGVILYELLAGALPYPARRGPVDSLLHEMFRDRTQSPARLRRSTPGVTPAVESIVARCLEPDPHRRYQSAQELQDDLERQLHHWPLRYAAEPSWRERARKWARRHPRLTSATSIGVLSLLLVVGLTAIVFERGRRLSAVAAHASWQRFHRDVLATQTRCLDDSVGRPAKPRALDSCRRTLKQFDILDNPNWQHANSFTALAPAVRQQLRGEAGELLYLMASLSGPRSGSRTMTADDRRDALTALELNQRASSCYPAEEAPDAVSRQRAGLLQQLGRFDEAAQCQQQVVRATSSARDLCMRACQYSLEHRFREALPLWQQASAREPQNLWASFGLANCYEQLSQPANAVAGFSACIALNPAQGDWYFRRGVAYLKLREFALATADFDRVVSIEPERNEARVNRALALLGANQMDRAIDELTHVLNFDPTLSRVYLMRAQARERAGDLAGARDDRQRSLRCEPSDELEWIARGAAQVSTDADAALAAFDKALEINPQSAAALESTAHVLSERLGRTGEAIEVLTRAIEQHPDRGGLVAGRGVLRARLEQRDAAIQDAERALSVDSSDSIRYQVAGIYALTSRIEPRDRQRALALLASAAREGYGDAYVNTDTDLDPIRADSEFQQLIDAMKTLQRLASPPKPILDNGASRLDSIGRNP